MVSIALLVRYLYHIIVLDPAQNINHSLNSAQAQTPIGQKFTNPLLVKLRNTFNQSGNLNFNASGAATPPIAKAQAQLSKKNDYFSTSEQLDVLDQVITKVEQKVRVNKTISKQAAEIAEATSINKTASAQTVQTATVARTTPAIKFQPPISKMKIVEPTVQIIPSLQSNPQGIMGQGLAAATVTATDNVAQSTLNPLTPSRSTKEAAEATGVDRAQVVEAARGAQAVEVEPTPEISPEVEAYIQKVQEDTQTPQKIVIADNIDAIPDISSHQRQPVIILPITPEIEKRARFKGPQFSVRWLVEWSKKMMKMFFGKVIYRQEEVRE